MIRLRQPSCGAGWIVFASCAMLGAAAAPAAAQSPPPPSREELLRQWDLDRDGKIDAGETEIARLRMRRTRNEALMNSGADPVTGRPRTRAAIDPVTGRPLAPQAGSNEPSDRRGGLATPADDDGLILVPGTGEPTDGLAGAAIGPTTPSRGTQPDRPTLPGTRVPDSASTVPSVAPRIPAGGMAPGSGAAGGRDAGSSELSSRARILPGMQQPGVQPPSGGQSYPGARDPRPRGSIPSMSQDRQPMAGERPGIISGGVRAGGAAARPGYGAGGPPTDLNAGRLPGGLPQTRGQARGVAPGIGVVPGGGGLPPGAGRLAGPGQVPPRTGTGLSAGRVAPSVPATGVPSPAAPLTPRPTLRQPAAVRPQSQGPSTAPRVPRVSPDDFYGR